MVERAKRGALALAVGRARAGCGGGEGGEGVRAPEPLYPVSAGQAVEIPATTAPAGPPAGRLLDEPGAVSLAPLRPGQRYATIYQPAPAPAGPALTEGQMVVDRLGHVVRREPGLFLELTAAEGEPASDPIRLLPGPLLEALERELTEGTDGPIRVSGELTHYRDDLYLVLRKVTVESPAPQPGPTPAQSEERSR